MNKLDYDIKDGNVYLSQPDFNLDETLDCGQAFRWEKTGENTYSGFFYRTPLTISQDKGVFTLYDTTEDDLLNIWADYFDLYTDYGELKRRFSEDETLSKACAYAGGIRLLRQDSWETLISFIISQNNNIPRIKGIIGRLCERYGGFPSAEQLEGLAPADFDYLRAGFRSKYLADCCERVNSGEINLEEIKSLPIDEARQKLMLIKGVGNKVADCELLFGMYKTDAFPKDVWIKRVMEEYYPNGLPSCVKGYEGIAQQYLFHYIRTGTKAAADK